MNEPELKMIEVYTPTCAGCFHFEEQPDACPKYDICSPMGTNKHHIFVEVKDELQK